MSSISIAVAEKLTSLRVTAERLAFVVDRFREGLLRRVRQRGGDPLSALMPADYALASGSCIAVTGGSDGIGREAAAFLAQRGFAVVLCARNQAKGEAALRYIRALPDAKSTKLALVIFDQSSVVDTARGAEEIAEAAKKLGVPLRGLLQNAGVWPTELRVTNDGLEEGMQVYILTHTNRFICLSIHPSIYIYIYMYIIYVYIYMYIYIYIYIYINIYMSMCLFSYLNLYTC